jgi:hypothetical protein
MQFVTDVPPYEMRLFADSSVKRLEETVAWGGRANENFISLLVKYMFPLSAVQMF